MMMCKQFWTPRVNFIGLLGTGVIALTATGFAQAQAVSGGTPNGSYAPLHAWYDVSQSLGVWEDLGGSNAIYNDEFLVDVRDTATGSGNSRGTSYGTNLETWAQFGGSWPRTGGFTGTQNGMTTWEVRNGAGWDDGGGWSDNDGTGTNGIGSSSGYTIMMALNIHDTTSYNGTWNVDPGSPNDDTPILNGVTSVWNTGASTSAQAGKGLLWLDADRAGESGATWVMDAGTEMVAGDVTFDQWQVHTFVYDGASSAHYINGSMVASGDAGSDPMGAINLWNSDGGWHRAGNLDFAEGMFYDEVLSGSDRSALESYLMNRWEIAAAFLEGDLNLDGSVNGQDLAILAANFGSAGQTLATGDITGDGLVNGQDLAILSANFGATSAALPGVTSVPEPGSLALLGLTGLAILRRRR